jgi:hypothetical protein
MYISYINIIFILWNYHLYILEIECDPKCENHGVCGTDPSNPDGDPICYCPSGFFGEACGQRKYAYRTNKVIIRHA